MKVYNKKKKKRCVQHDHHRGVCTRNINNINIIIEIQKSKSM
jgi:hypothetical protein